MKGLGHVNIIVAGKTGVGKSTLINSVFREKLADTGIGAPVTTSIKRLEKQGFPLRAYDTVGLTLGAERVSECESEIGSIIRDAQRSGDADQYIHCIWYCISVDSNRLEPEEEALINRLASQNTDINVPVIIVLTLAHNRKRANEMKRYVDSRNLNVKRSVCVLAEVYEDYDYKVEAYGGEELVTFTESVLPESARRAFVNAQSASLKLKRSRARSVVMTTAATSFGEGFIPLPFADSMVLVPTQIGMIASITAVYGVHLNKAMMSAIITSLLGTTGATVAGRAIVGNLFKFLPGAGTLLGGTISGGTASLITTALGETYIAVMEAIVRGEMQDGDLQSSAALAKIKSLFRKNLKIFSKKKGKDGVIFLADTEAVK